MKYRDSGMPARDFWETLLDVETVLTRFGFGSHTGEVAELGCGYGTFTIPLAQRTRETVHAFDIDPAMIEMTRRRAVEADLPNVRVALRDVAADGFGLAEQSCGACLLFNILHGEAPVAMLREAARIVGPGGVVAVIHWRSDIATPRGPNLDIRPRPEQITTWAGVVESLEIKGPPFLLPPWHFGMQFVKVAPDARRNPAGAGGQWS